MNEEERLAWKSFVAVVQNFLGNYKTENCTELFEEMLFNLKNLSCNMSIKVHYVYSHIDHFQHNLGDLSEEQEQRFHQDQGKWNVHMMAYYYW